MTVYRLSANKQIGAANDGYKLNSGDLLWITASGSLLNDQNFNTITTTAAASGFISIRVDGFVFSQLQPCVSDTSANTTNLLINVGETGVITSQQSQALLLKDGDSVVNAGEISGNGLVATVRATTGFTLSNSGLIAATAFHEAIRFVSGEVSNAGAIFGYVVAEGDASITNTGSIDYGLSLGSGSVSNSGTLGPLTMQHGTVQNSGVINSGIEIDSLAGQETRIFNAGDVVSVAQAVRGGGGDERVVNRGSLLGDVFLGDGADRFDTRGGETSGFILGEGGSDTLIGGAGEEDLRGGNQNDSITGGGGDDLLDGGADNDTVKGGAGDDQLTGVAGNDQLYGGDGDDLVSGGDGADTLAGGRGDDDLTGGAGSDRFTFAWNFGHDVIEDFVASGRSSERIVFAPGLFDDFAQLSDHMHAVSGGVLIEVSGDDTIFLRGVSMESLDAGDFVFG